MEKLAVSHNVGGIDPLAYTPLGMHLVGSVPLPSADDVFRTMSAAVGDRLRRMADGETGARADWIVWQYPVLSSRPQFEVAPPTPDFYKALPRLKLNSSATRRTCFISREAAAIWRPFRPMIFRRCG